MATRGCDLKHNLSPYRLKAKKPTAATPTDPLLPLLECRAAA